MPSDTYKSGRGDGEDTAILLADMLISHGIEARLAIGYYHAANHTWVVARVEGKEYIVESTVEDLTGWYRPKYVEEEGRAYNPLFLVDRDAVYVKREKGRTTEYYSPVSWIRHAVPKVERPLWVARVEN